MHVHLVMKMKTLPKLWKLLAIAILLTGINGNACFAETPGRSPSMALLPDRHKCLDLLELERLKVNPQQEIISGDIQLAADYRTVWGWLQGFFTAWNLNAASDGNVAKGATSYQVMAWIFSYCRAHPSEHLLNAASEFMNAMRTTKK
jgi:hypothetical protein